MEQFLPSKEIDDRNQRAVRIITHEIDIPFCSELCKNNRLGGLEMEIYVLSSLNGSETNFVAKSNI